MGKRPDALVRFDPATETFQSWPIPSGGIYAGMVRHMCPTRDGNLLIHQSSTNRIILVEPDGAATQHRRLFARLFARRRRSTPPAPTQAAPGGMPAPAAGAQRGADRARALTPLHAILAPECLIAGRPGAIDGPMSAAAASLTGRDQRWDEVDQRFQRVDQRLDNVECRLGLIEQVLEALTKRITRLEEKIVALEEKVIALAQDVAVIRAELGFMK